MSADNSGGSVDHLLRAADDLLSSVVPGTRGLWPRTTAFLIRTALEQALHEYWRAVRPELIDCSMRAQLLCAWSYLGDATAQRLTSAWTALSAACHYHTYELAPTAAELRRWHDDTSQVAADLAATPR